MAQWQKIKLQEIKDSTGLIKFKLNNEYVTFQTISLEGKEAIALTNATAIMLSIGVHLIHDVDILLKNADIAAALSLEAMMCEKDAFADELHQLRHQEGQINTARNIRSLTKNSRRMTVEARHEFFKTITEDELKQNLIGENKKNDIATIAKYKFDYEFEKSVFKTPIRFVVFRRCTGPVKMLSIMSKRLSNVRFQRLLTIRSFSQKRMVKAMKSKAVATFTANLWQWRWIF